MLGYRYICILQGDYPLHSNLMNRDIHHHLRKDYKHGELIEERAALSPIQQFRHWFSEALNSHAPEPNAMTLATSSPDGKPSVRVVLLKELDDNGFVFYTNYNSQKGQQLQLNPYAALCFHWHELQRQVRIEGKIEKISRQDSLAYFNSRPLGSQLGAWASAQSQTIDSREMLDERLAQTQEKFNGLSVLPLPENWGGYRLVPNLIEFWQGRSNRMHDRLCYKLDENNQWVRTRLMP